MPPPEAAHLVLTAPRLRPSFLISLGKLDPILSKVQPKIFRKIHWLTSQPACGPPQLASGSVLRRSRSWRIKHKSEIRFQQNKGGRLVRMQTKSARKSPSGHSRRF
jgi:hypothetical protein